jgi:hypothetical protein
MSVLFFFFFFSFFYIENLANFNPKTKSQICQIYTRKKKFQKILNFFVENSEILPGKINIGGGGGGGGGGG